MSEITRTDIPIGELVVDGYQLADGEYRMSQAQAAEAIGESPVYALRFLRSNDSKALLGEAYTDYTPEAIALPTKQGARGESRMNALPLEVVSAYWLYRAYRGNKRAMSLCMALITESLERRFDTAFGVTRTESERNARLIERNAQLEQALNIIRSGLEFEAELERENAYFWQWFQDRNIDPYALPSEEDE